MQRLVQTVAMLAAAALASLAVAAVAAPSSSSALVATCTARQLHATVKGSSGAAGTVILRVALSNVGTRCTIAGYPTLELHRKTQRMPTRTVRGGLPLLETTADTVTLAPGGSTYLLVAYSDMPTRVARDTAAVGFSPCPAASGVRITVPGWQRAVEVPATIVACNGGTLRISPFLHPAGQPAGPAAATG